MLTLGLAQVNSSVRVRVSMAPADHGNVPNTVRYPNNETVCKRGCHNSPLAEPALKGRAYYRCAESLVNEAG